MVETGILNISQGRTPQGVRGLKLDGYLRQPAPNKSHSARSAWIETYSEIYECFLDRVALRKECVD